MLRKILKYLSYSSIIAMINIITIPYLSRKLTLEELGFIGLMYVYTSILVPIFYFQSIGLVGVKKAKLTTKKYRDFLNSYITLTLAISILTTIILQVLSLTKDHSMVYLLFLINIIALIRYLTHIHDQELIQDQKINLYGKLTVSSSFITLALTVILISFIEMTWDGRLWSIIFAEAFLVFLRFFVYSEILKKYKPYININHTKEIFGFGSPLFLALAGSWVIFQSDKLLVAYFFSLDAVGLYTIAFLIGSSVRKINQAVRNAFTPEIRKKLNEKNYSKFKEKYITYYTLILFTIVITLTVTLFFYEKELLGKNYEGTWKVSGLIACAYAFFGIYLFYGIVFEYFQLTKLKTIIVCVGAVSNLIASLILIPITGYIGPAIGTVIGLLLVTALSIHYGNKVLFENERNKKQ